MSAEDVGNYFFLFSLQPPVDLSGFALPTDMKLGKNQNELANSLEVNATGVLEDVKKETIQRVKKLVALLSLQGVEVTATYGSLYRLLPNGAKAFQVVVMEAISFQDSILPNNIEPIIDVTSSLNIGDVKLWRQMGHYHKGETSNDPIERYREFYQVIEDENASTSTERALRHALNHPMLTSPPTVAEVTRVLGSSYFDPLNQNHLDIIGTYADQLQEKARKILLAKI
jgi:hypothetical protein